MWRNQAYERKPYRADHLPDRGREDKNQRPHGGGGDYFDELLERIRDIRTSEKAFWRKVLDIYAASADYSAKAEESAIFSRTVQNKMLFAATGHTAAELVSGRANALLLLMGVLKLKGA
ncbi:MAG: RhuM family protein [Synergistes jonesii]|uniref:RhuM family protein n=1 Tax=Synergistes jonesii TaxID=2754 RepID=UPI002A74B314|nr:RhuM family protein [Synergistes jonesii]MDY2985010.1 RhuM family protein [Synergistes jonesii]